MFTGIISNTTKVINFSKSDNTLSLLNVLGDIPNGTSIAVDGACLTVANITNKYISFDVSEETISKTIINCYRNDTLVNLELPSTPSTLLGGHLVLGHVDTVGTLDTIETINDNLWNFYFSVNDGMYIVDKGSITINGISLTTNVINSNQFYVSIINETYSKTNLSELEKTNNTDVNIEYDIIGKYVYKYTK